MRLLILILLILAVPTFAQPRNTDRAPWCSEAITKNCRDRAAYENDGETGRTVAEQPTCASNQRENKSSQGQSGFDWGWLFFLIPLFWWTRTMRY